MQNVDYGYKQGQTLASFDPNTSSFNILQTFTNILYLVKKKQFFSNQISFFAELFN